MLSYGLYFELLELVQWMYNRVDIDDLTVYRTSKISTLSLGFCIAASAFKTVWLLGPLGYEDGTIQFVTGSRRSEYQHQHN